LDGTAEASMATLAATLDDLFLESGIFPDIVKIDVEGFELEV
jgi:FkbM family methyltransferase